MEVEVKVKQLPLHRVLMAALALSLVVAVAAAEAISSEEAAATKVQTLPGCNSTCGGVTIPYPFGIGMSSKPDQPCYLEPKFNLDCNDYKLYFGNVQVLAIAIEGQVDVMFFVSSTCYNKYGGNTPKLDTASFRISSKENKFLTVGCDSYGYLDSLYYDRNYSTGCFTRCYGNNITPITKNGTCSGIGCCQVDVPPMMRNITVQASGFTNSKDSLGCTNSFVVKQGSYNFSTTDVEAFPHTELPLVLDWAVGNKSCNASKSGTDYACKSNSDCVDEDIDYGYRCTCKPGYEGNSYHPDGCTDIDECKRSGHGCIDEKNCRNFNGTHECFCRDGTEKGGCHKQEVLTKVIIGAGAGAGIIILFVGIATLYLTYQKRKLMKLKVKFFRENGGFILQQKLSTREDSSQTART